FSDHVLPAQENEVRAQKGKDRNSRSSEQRQNDRILFRHAELQTVGVPDFPPPSHIIEQDILSKTSHDVAAGVENAEVRKWKLDFVELPDLEHLFRFGVVPVKRDMPLRNEEDENQTGQPKYGQQPHQLERAFESRAERRSDQIQNERHDKLAAKERRRNCGQHDESLRQQCGSLDKHQWLTSIVGDV